MKISSPDSRLPTPDSRFHSRVSPWLFVPTLYFVEGVPYVIINNVSVIFYKQLGVDNTQIAFWTSFLYLPWVLKMFWGPIVDGYATKRKWTIYTQLTMVLCLLSLAFSLQSANSFVISLIILIIGAFISATHDIAADGFYMLALERDAQAFFVGIRSTFYRFATIFASGIVVFLAGQLEIKLENITLGWTIAIAISALIFAAIAIFHWFALPVPITDSEQKTSARAIVDFYRQTIQSYFSQQKILAVLAFILFYRFGEGMLVKISAPFLLDETAVGGLGLSTSEVGLVYGTIGTFALVLGGVIGGILIAELELKKIIWWMAIALNLPNLFYVYMAYTQPTITLVYVLVAIEQFGYGLGMAAYSVYLIYIAKEEYKTSHFAISTGIMALGMMLPGFISGYLQQVLGYPMFFVLICFLAIPGIFTLYFIPLDLEKCDK
ncbi:MAG: Anhydromuropeptide permease [Chroococcidiopsis sp. SAG 2025]|uniref:MFS transporter n=1 Tax=Chroococcidiopsis sp. SAG 2025 TaxID=171389 RepID=UPI002936DCAB|nr:MFS transporter [Chroococcidiopsis sp. SAG 2025]MDV2992746.1 Anhydromuropeptide permease [Chroococcidiopsis sp. SAG 2025]